MKTLKIPVNAFQFYEVAGGPYKERPTTFRGVKMAVEIDRPFDVNIPTKDYNVPKTADLTAGLQAAVTLLLQGEPLYVGCMGGVGRTGLFLAVLAKAFGQRDPVPFVRAGYNPHAVETDQQLDYVRRFAIDPAITAQIRTATRFSWLRFWKRNLTRLPGTTAAESIGGYSDDFPDDEWDEEIEPVQRPRS